MSIHFSSSSVERCLGESIINGLLSCKNSISSLFWQNRRNLLIFAKLISNFPSEEEEEVYEDTFVDEHIFLIPTLDPLYGDIIIYLQMLKVPTHLSRDERRRLRHISKNYIIVDNTLYCRGVDSILFHCLTHEEAEVVLNDCHGGACGGHLSGLSTAQKFLRAGYFLPSIFKDCVNAVKKFHPC